MKERKAPKASAEMPEPESEAWKAIPWRKLEKHVYRIQKRIYRAGEAGQVRKVQKLQKLLMKSEAARLLAVRRVTQENQGKKTAGVDGVKSVKPAERILMAKQIHPKQWKGRKTRPVRRVWIPKPGKAEQRPLGIPVMIERAQQALVKSALEPEWESQFEADSYGFRPGRSAQDAIQAIFNAIRYKPKFVLDADIKGCFDAINQEELLRKLKTTPQVRKIIKNWLKAGVIDEHVFTPTETGTPQGGVISPLLANIALHGMAKAITAGMNTKQEKPILIRYADDFIILHSKKEEIEKATQKVTEWLRSMGLILSPTKTKVTHTLIPDAANVGFDFLGYTVRQFPAGKTHTGKNPGKKPLGFKTIIKPSKKSVKTHIQETNQWMNKLKSAPQEALIKKFNPIIKGWSNYHKTICAKETFARCDWTVHAQTMEWARKRHHNKGKQWIVQKYWHPEEGRRWVFAAPIETQEGKSLLRLRRHGQTEIQRHTKVRGKASPYDGNLVYWSQRLKKHPLMGSTKAKLLHIQKGMCPRCGLYFRDEDLLEIDHIIPTALGGKDTLANKWVYHRHCHDEKTAEDMEQIRATKAAGINNKRP
jgi:RNA-directed DNA polymerase